MRALVLAALGAAFLCSLAWAHGEAEWIRREPRFLTVNSIHCCGPADCMRAPKGAVRATADGYQIVATGQVIPYTWKALYRSIDEDFWWCLSGGTKAVKCLFAPQAGA